MGLFVWDNVYSKVMEQKDVWNNQKKRITKYADRASEYLEQTFTPEAPPVVPKKESITRFKLDTDLSGSTSSSKDSVKYQKKTPPSDSGVR